MSCCIYKLWKTFHLWETVNMCMIQIYTSSCDNNDIIVKLHLPHLLIVASSHIVATTYKSMPVSIIPYSMDIFLYHLRIIWADRFPYFFGVVLDFCGASCYRVANFNLAHVNNYFTVCTCKTKLLKLSYYRWRITISYTITGSTTEVKSLEFLQKKENDLLIVFDTFIIYLHIS